MTAPTLQQIFAARCEARALLCDAGDLDLHTAVDELQLAATACGLTAEIGQDTVQAILAAAFSRKLAPAPSSPLGDRCALLLMLIDPQTTLERANEVLNTREGAASSTMAAACWLAAHHPKRFDVWLAQRSDSERAAICQHLRKGRP